VEISLGVQNESTRKRLYRRDVLRRLASRIGEGEGLTAPIEISVLFCDDPRMAELNGCYRNKKQPTDVLSFEQEPIAGVETSSADGAPVVLGDIVISLETVEHNCGGDRALMRDEVSLLFCHGLLHLLGYDHAAKRERDEMIEKQALYLGVSQKAAWAFGPKPSIHTKTRTQGAGGQVRLGR
jgi:probable rRNA maturation factor